MTAEKSPMPGQSDASIFLSVVIPAFREEGAVGRVVEAVRAILTAERISHEIIVVNDGSPDGTGQAAAAAGATVINHPYNRGYGASLKTGIRKAVGEYVVTMDADGQHDPADLPSLVARAGELDMVIGKRPGMSGSPNWRKPGKLVLGFVANQLTGRKIPDLNCGFRLMKREMITRYLVLMPDGFSFSTTSTIACMKGGYLVDYQPIRIHQRVGVSTVTAADGFKAILLIFRIVTLFAPLRVFLPLAVVTMLIGLLFIALGYILEGTASLKGITVVLAALLFFLFGLLADQIAALRRGESVK